MGNEAELMAGRAVNELRELKLEPRAATLAAHFVNVLRGDRIPLLLVDFYSTDGCGFSWCNFPLYSSDEQRNVGGLGKAFLHDQIPDSRLKRIRRDGAGTAAANRKSGAAAIGQRCCRLGCPQVAACRLIGLPIPDIQHENPRGVGKGPLLTRCCLLRTAA